MAKTGWLMNSQAPKTAVITGGAGGLGLALAKQLISLGWHICLIDLAGERLNNARLEFNNNSVSTYECDLTSPEQVKKTSQKIINEHPSIDLVIYNAGITQIGELTDAPLSAHQRVFDVNYFGALYLLREMIEPVRTAKGMHVAVSSVAGFSPLFHRTAYSASKHALEGLFKSLRAEESEHGVHVSIAAPSFVATNIDNPEPETGGIARPGSAADGVDYMSPADAAKAMIKGIEKRKTYIPIGRIARLAYVINRLFPELYYALMMRNIAKKGKDRAIEGE